MKPPPLPKEPLYLPPGDEERVREDANFRPKLDVYRCILEKVHKRTQRWTRDSLRRELGMNAKDLARYELHARARKALPFESRGESEWPYLGEGERFAEEYRQVLFSLDYFGARTF